MLSMDGKELALLAGKGDRAALGDLWEKTRPLLLSLAWKFYTRQGKERCSSHGVVLEDLQQETFFALWDAVRAYKPEKGWQFTTYLNWATENRFRACMGLRRAREDPLNMADRLEEPLSGDEEGREKGELLEDPQAEGALLAVDEEDAHARVRGALAEALKALPPSQKEVLRLRFALLKTRPETARALGISPAGVRQEEQRALGKLRRLPPVRMLRDDVLAGEAYHGTGWHSWYYKQGSVEERLAEQT